VSWQPSGREYGPDGLPLHSRHIIVNYELLRADPRRPKGGPRLDRVPVCHDAKFLLGCDLGQANDYTALCLLQRGATGCKVSLAQPHPWQDLPADRPRPELENRTQLVVDATGVSRAATDMLRDAGLNPVRITIISGFKAVGTRGKYKEPKQDLISSLIIALETDRLKIASGMKHADELRRELEHFRMTHSGARISVV
jgi:hypothetical protein